MLPLGATGKGDRTVWAQRLNSEGPSDPHGVLVTGKNRFQSVGGILVVFANEDEQRVKGRLVTFQLSAHLLTEQQAFCSAQLCYHRAQSPTIYQERAAWIGNVVREYGFNDGGKDVDDGLWF